MDTIYRRTGERIRELRLLRRMTQQNLAERSGISVSFLSFLEKGYRKGSLKTYENLSAALGIQLSELFKEPFKAKKMRSAERLSLPNLSASEIKAISALVRQLRRRR